MTCPGLSLCSLACWFGMAFASVVQAAPQISHDAVQKCVVIADAAGQLRLRLCYDGRCMLDQVDVRGRQVIANATGVYSAIRVGDKTFSTQSAIAAPQVDVRGNTVAVSGIRFGGNGVNVEEAWTFTAAHDHIDWRITRKYLSGGALDDACLPGWDFADTATWTGALLGTGGVAWFKLFDTPVAAYGVHTGPVTFWNKEHGSCLRIEPHVPANRHIAARFSRRPNGVLAFSHWVTAQPLATKHKLQRFLKDRQDVWAPVRVAPGECSLTMTLTALDYRQAYDRGAFRAIDGDAVREICNTIARLGVIDANIMGSNGWYSGYAVLQEPWLAQLGLPIDDPAYVHNFSRTLDYQRQHAIDATGRVKARWCHVAGDDEPGTYDRCGFYECQWGRMLDTQPAWVINVAEQFDFNGDIDWLRSQKTACEQALDFLLRRDTNDNGLVEVMTDSHAEKKGCDWLDVVWASFETASINAQMYCALQLWAEREALLGDADRAARYRTAAARLKSSFNRTTAESGFWNPDRQWYVHWRDKDGSVHGDNLVLPINFMAIAYGLCDDPLRCAAILRQTETAMQREKLFFWPACFFSYTQDEGHPTVNWPFPSYENGDIFLAWGEVATRAYVHYDPAIAVRYVQNVLRQYGRDGLAFQRYLRRTQAGAGDDILANMANPVVGLYRNIYGLQPKWNRLYLEPHLTPELNGTQLKYNLRGQRYVIDLHTARSRITVAGASLSDTQPFAIRVQGDTVQGDTVQYFPGKQDAFALAAHCVADAPLTLDIEAWPTEPTATKRWRTSCATPRAEVRYVVQGLLPTAAYRLTCDGRPDVVLHADAAGQITCAQECAAHGPQNLALIHQTTP